jgi:hypothetical protein
MTYFRLVSHLHGALDTAQIWFIECVALKTVQYRLRFEGTEQDADAEVARLNAFARAKVHDPWQAATLAWRRLQHIA